MVTYKATVTSQFGDSVTGTVTFKDGTSNTTVAVSNGVASLTESYSANGTHTVTATYSGDSNNNGSVSNTWTEYVEKLPVGTTTKISTSGSPSTINQPVTFTANVTSIYGS